MFARLYYTTHTQMHRRKWYIYSNKHILLHHTYIGRYTWIYIWYIFCTLINWFNIKLYFPHIWILNFPKVFNLIFYYVTYYTTHTHILYVCTFIWYIPYIIKQATHHLYTGYFWHLFVKTYFFFCSLPQDLNVFPVLFIFITNIGL